LLADILISPSAISHLLNVSPLDAKNQNQPSLIREGPFPKMPAVGIATQAPTGLSQLRERAISTATSTWNTWRRPLAAAVLTSLVLRVVTELVALVSYYGVNFPHVVGAKHDVLFSVWYRWDAGYFASIARSGYPGGSFSQSQMNLIAFAPLYPWTLRLAHVVTGLGWITSGLAVSAAATVLSMTGLYRLVQYDGNNDLPGTALALLAAWPAAFFLLAGYADSLALMFAVWAFIAARSNRWLTVGILVAAAAMTKYDAVIILLALAVALWDTRNHSSIGQLAVRLASLVIPSLIWIGSWMAYCAVHLGDPLAFVKAQRAWGRDFAWPWTLVARTVGDLVHLRFLDTRTASVTELFDAVTVLLLLAATIYAFSSMQRYYGVLLLSGLAIFVCEPILLSVTREVILFFALFIVLAHWCGRMRNLERLLYAGFLPLGYFLIERFVNLRFAG
jgi:Dolichyl-phosphate-mannose-protein mannosyltransferase